MRSQLIELGFDVPLRKYLFEAAEVAKSGLQLSGTDDRQVASQHGAAPSVGTGARPQRKYTLYSRR
jgi:hypothetical protein